MNKKQLKEIVINDLKKHGNMIYEKGKEQLKKETGEFVEECVEKFFEYVKLCISEKREA